MASYRISYWVIMGTVLREIAVSDTVADFPDRDVRKAELDRDRLQIDAPWLPDADDLLRRQPAPCGLRARATWMMEHVFLKWAHCGYPRLGDPSGHGRAAHPQAQEGELLPGISEPRRTARRSSLQ